MYYIVLIGILVLLLLFAVYFRRSDDGRTDGSGYLAVLLFDFEKTNARRR